MEVHRLQYSLNSEPFQAQETMPHSADLRVHLLLLPFLCFQSLCRVPFLIMSQERELFPSMSAIPDLCFPHLYWAGGAVSCGTLEGFPTFSLLLQQFLCRVGPCWVVAPILLWSRHYHSTQYVKPEMFSLSSVFPIQQSLLCSQYCNGWQTWSHSLFVSVRGCTGMIVSGFQSVRLPLNKSKTTSRKSWCFKCLTQSDTSRCTSPEV